ncbi:MAG: hypothetical protein IJW48_01470 [Clostridia bacterium]|nr:hypothetical protein [Clostridia bacterium]
MKLLLHITLAKIKRSPKKCLSQSFAVFVSMLVISFFVCFIFSLEAFGEKHPAFGINVDGWESALTIESLNSFFRTVLSAIGFLAGATAMLSAVSLYVYSRMRIDEDKQFYATLASIGATAGERTAISTLETLILYGVPVVIGSFFGMIPSRWIATAVIRIFVSDYSVSPATPLIPLLLSLVGLLTVLAFTRIPTVKRKKSVIAYVRAHNEKEAAEPRSYRKSYTFRHMPIEQRIAKKSIEYHSGAYRRITIMMISCALYPVLAIFFIVLISSAEVSDYTPSYGIDIEALVDIFASSLAVFGAVAFLVLTVFGILQTIYMIQAQNRVRMQAFKVYKSLGMTDKSIRRVLYYEYRAVVLRAAACLVVFGMFLLVLLYGIG